MLPRTYDIGHSTTARFDLSSISARSVSKANLLDLRLPLPSLPGPLTRGCLALVIIVLFGASLTRAQGTYTAASCNRSDVNAVINGPTHTAVSGDVIIIPTTGSPCTWTSGITISGKGIDITGTGTPNTGGGTFGAGTPSTTLIDNAAAPLFTFTNLGYGQTAKVELLTLTGAGANNSVLPAPLSFSGTCTISGCAEIRVDNINFSAGTWAGPTVDGSYIAEDNVFGVVDHNTVNETAPFPGGGAGPPLLDTSNDAWQGVGGYGDNSFATADTFGTAQVLYVENNSLTAIRINDNDVPPTGGGAGGARLACRFNKIFNMNGSGACGAAHGTAWGGRFRGQRQLEAYYNQATCPINTPCNTAFSIPSGTGYVFSNTLTASTGSGMNASVSIALYRTEGYGAAPWNNCDGTQPWDQSPWSSTSECLDQPGTGAGLLLANATPVLSSALGTVCSVAGLCWTQNALDPVYEAGDSGSNLAAGVEVSDPTRLAGHYYAEVSKSPQSSPTSPFNGTSGTGYGTLANRPATCTTGVGYWATDQGNWNTYGSQEGELSKCSSTNTWTMIYQPYTYPHPLTAGGGSGTGPAPNAPTDLTATVN